MVSKTLSTIDSAGSPFSHPAAIPWKPTRCEMLSPVGERIPQGTLVKVWQSRNFGWIAIHPESGLKRRLFKQ